MTRTQFYTATSLDGFLATTDHSLDWLFTQDQDPAGPLNYREFIAGVGALAMGSRTYEWILGHEFPTGDLTAGSWPYEQPAWVFTTRDLPAVPGADLRFVRGDVQPVHREMVDAAAGRNVWVVGGGELVGRFADHGLLHDVLVMIAPVTLGAGPPLLPRRLDLSLQEVARNGDFACARYTVGGASG